MWLLAEVSLILKCLNVVSTWQARRLLFSKMEILEAAWCGPSRSHYLHLTFFFAFAFFFFMAVTFYSYMLITFSTSYSTKLNLESNMFKSLLSARSKNAWILSWQQHANLEDFSLLSWRMLSLFEVRMWEVSMLARPTGSPWSHASTARKMYSSCS